MGLRFNLPVFYVRGCQYTLPVFHLRRHQYTLPVFNLRRHQCILPVFHLKGGQYTLPVFLRRCVLVLPCAMLQSHGKLSVSQLWRTSVCPQQQLE